MQKTFINPFTCRMITLNQRMSLNLFVLLNLFLKMYCQVANSLFSVGFEMAPFQNLVFVHPKFAFASQALKQYVNGNMIKSLPKNCRAQNDLFVIHALLTSNIIPSILLYGNETFLSRIHCVLWWKICAVF